MMKRTLSPAALLAAGICILVSADASAEPSFALKLEGLKGELLQNAEAQIGVLNTDAITVQGRYRARIRQAVREALRAYGYYQPKLKFKWEPKPAKGPRTLHLTVDPGEVVKLKSVDVVLEGEAKSDRAFERLLKNLPKPGDPLRHADYDAFKSDVQNIAMRRGYFEGDWRVHELAVAPDLGIGFWRLTYDSGRRWRFGDVRWEGSQIDERYLDNIVPFKEGEPFAAWKVSKLNDRLSQTGWFNSVVVAPDWKNASKEEKIVPMSGAVSPRTGNSVEVGMGYSTDVGPRFKGKWEKPWINSSGHSLSSSTSLSSGEQTVDGAYKIPVEENPIQEYWLLQGGFKHTDLNDTKSTSATVGLMRYWEMETGWQRSLGLRWGLDNFTQGEDDYTTMLIYPGATLSRTRSRGGMMPRWGDSQRYTLDVSNSAWGSDVDFIAFSAQGAIIRTFALKHRFLLRGQFGWLETNDFSQVPPDLRFFAGGDRSVRGYGYKKISPKDDSGDLIGAERLLTASIEYQYNVTGKWWGAVFVDTGEAVPKFTGTSFKTGVGFGIRWESPIGPVKLDIAKPVGDPDENGIEFYIGLGPEL